jgi:3-hydroxybutyryl-CoA dehydrogenase
MKIGTVGVVGCGLMGAGIAQVCAQKGCAVIVRDLDDRLLEAGIGRIRAFLAEGIKRGKVSQEEMDRTLAAIRGTTSLGDLAVCDLVVEAVVERLEEKKRVFTELDRICRPGAILASNTSSISIAAIAAATGRPERCLGLHFMNPVPLMKLVEIVRPEATSGEVYAAARAFVESLGKTAVTVKDSPGFIVNLLLMPYVCDAVRAVERGLASPEDVDTAMKLGCGMPMGPIELADHIGLDTTLSIVEVLHEGFRDDRYLAPELLRRKVAEGSLGRKTGSGFYAYVSK